MSRTPGMNIMLTAQVRRKRFLWTASASAVTTGHAGGDVVPAKMMEVVSCC